MDFPPKVLKYLESRRIIALHNGEVKAAFLGHG